MCIYIYITDRTHTEIYVYTVCLVWRVDGLQHIRECDSPKNEIIWIHRPLKGFAIFGKTNNSGLPSKQGKSL